MVVSGAEKIVPDHPGFGTTSTVDITILKMETKYINTYFKLLDFFAAATFFFWASNTSIGIADSYWRNQGL